MRSPFGDDPPRRPELDPGRDWFVADFDGECSRGGHVHFGPGTVVRNDGADGLECRKCVDTDDTRREDEPGDWCIADFDGECSRCGREFGKNVTVRADGAGDFECRVCVDEDQRKVKDQDAYEAELLTGRPFGENWQVA